MSDGSGGTTAVSIDPFFFRVRNQAADLDFYVRDWTNSAIDNDIGLEPSTNPVFYNTSDVWNRRTNTAGGFDSNDRPQSQNPQVVSAGSNFAFARVHRKATGTAQTVTTRFLKSEFGTGSNYQDASAAAAPSLSFAAGALVQTMSSGYEWTLTATSSTHVCLAVEISAPNDPVIGTSLLGRAPGWPTTDLSVINDNNKAQRNLGVYTGLDGGAAGAMGYWALVHNARTRVRDVVIQIVPDPRLKEFVQKTPPVVAGRGDARIDGDRLILFGMQPGENRWVRLEFPSNRGLKQGESLGVSFMELVGSLPVNGFTIAVRDEPLELAAVESLRLLAGNLFRANALLKGGDELNIDRWLASLAETKSLNPKLYADAVRLIHPSYREVIAKAIEKTAGVDPFGLKGRVAALGEALDSRETDRIFGRQTDLDHAVDAFLTYVDKQRGDVADVGQNMRWQADLVRSIPKLRVVPKIDAVVEVAVAFDADYSGRVVRADDYPEYVAKILPVLTSADEILSLGTKRILDETRQAISRRDTLSAQKWHREFLLRLEQLR